MTGIGLIFLLILIAVLVWLFFRTRTFAVRKSEGAQAEVPEETHEGARVSRFAGIPGKWLGWGPWRRSYVSPGEFKDWLGDQMAASRRATGAVVIPQAFLDWLDSLSDEDWNLFFSRVSAFQTELHMGLEWLVGGELDDIPDLQLASEEATLHCCLAYWRSAEAEGDVRSFEAFRAWQTDSLSSKQKEFGARLFAILVDRGLVSPPPPQLFLSSEEDRIAYSVQSIRDLAEKDSRALFSAVREVIAPNLPGPALDLAGHPELAQVGTQPLDLSSYDSLLGGT